MAKAEVVKVCPTCGKTFKWTTTKYNRTEANSWEEWAEGVERECPACYRDSLRKAREAEEQKALEEAKTNPFGIDIDAVDLGGSEKQNAWAKKILAQWMQQIDLELMIRDVAYWAMHDKGEGFLKFILNKERLGKYRLSLGVSEKPTKEEQDLVRADLLNRLTIEVKSRNARYWIDSRDYYSGATDNIVKTAAYKLRDEIEQPSEAALELAR